MTTVPEAATGFRLLEERSDCPRISAVNTDGGEICGAYRPRGHSYWVLYTTMSVTTVTGLRPPHHAHLSGRTDAQAWVKMVGALYAHATA